jgi:ribose transport system substrate-binding protein
MQAEVALHPEIADFEVLDAEAADDKQISDIESLTSAGCDALIVSPNTTATLTPAVEAACETGIPVIVFDRGVNTDCPVTFIKPIGGYAFGADAAEFLVDEVEPGGKVLALRILPGVDVLETRFAAAQQIFEDSEIELVGAEFTEGDAANTKNIVSDYIQREGQLDGIWMDAGATALAAIEAFEDAGVDVPPITGEDQQDFLQKWDEDGLTAVAPTYPTYQWRTPVIAAVRILSGEQVPAEWNLPQPLITEDNLQDYLQPDMPPLHYALCGCEDMPGFPQAWQ